MQSATILFALVAFAATASANIGGVWYGGLPVPVRDNLDVAQARQAHLGAHAAATSQALSALQAAIARGSVPVQINSRSQVPVILAAGGVPLEGADVVQARAEHQRAVAEATARNLNALAAANARAAVAPVVVARAPVAWVGAGSLPLAPIDNPDVLAAKVAHAQAHAEARARNLVGSAIFGGLGGKILG